MVTLFINVSKVNAPKAPIKISHFLLYLWDLDTKSPVAMPKKDNMIMFINRLVLL